MCCGGTALPDNGLVVIQQRGGGDCENYQSNLSATECALIKRQRGRIPKIFALVCGRYPMRGRTALGVCEVADPPHVWMTLQRFNSKERVPETVKSISAMKAATGTSRDHTSRGAA